ncbi:MAG: bifunctional 3-deoxy-7-phosphoheptulonate synthase/chorismate mutase type II [Gemmatimonadetes bacterium]|nr:bifunctional 3-deoxy-7-phosphoheptulonate synthase/chorismate mutase type II [Gemmatimonadota bacterium]
MTVEARPMSHWSSVDRPPLVIAGPCSAESEEQVLETAARLAPLRVHYLRAGIWKARTRPDSFEGIGAPALKWLVRAGAEHGMRTATEVAHAHHVEAALEAGVDLLWIGARTTVNPFSVQELANALRGCTVPVFVKNPTAPDFGLWMGAFERVAAAGIRDLGAIHRGVSVADSAPFRNAPMWSLVLELRRELPDLPLLCDPSHICGRRDLLETVAQRAMDLGLDGLMLESHRDPDKAWSDAAQQVTPERLGGILSKLEVRSNAEDPVFTASVEGLREEIDALDQKLVELLVERLGVVDRIADLKQARHVTPFQLDRWRQLLVNRLAHGERLGLRADYVQAVFDTVHEESLRRQSERMAEDQSSTT